MSYPSIPTYVGGRLVAEKSQSPERLPDGKLKYPNKLFCEYYNNEHQRAERVEVPWPVAITLLPEQVRLAELEAEFPAEQTKNDVPYTSSKVTITNGQDDRREFPPRFLEDNPKA